jgi:apolipoprotein D and lipocalin family protein
MKTKILTVLFAALLTSCTTTGTKGTPDKIDFSLYQGTWFEIARLPNNFEEGLKCITATYSYNEDGMILLTNKGVNKHNPDDIKTLTARAWVPDPEHPENLKVQFVWPVVTDYLLVHINRDKGYAIIGTPSRKLLWFLSRSESIPETDMEELKRIASKNEYNTERLVYVEHGCGK